MASTFKSPFFIHQFFNGLFGVILSTTKILTLLKTSNMKCCALNSPMHEQSKTTLLLAELAQHHTTSKYVTNSWTTLKRTTKITKFDRNILYITFFYIIGKLPNQEKCIFV